MAKELEVIDFDSPDKKGTERQELAEIEKVLVGAKLEKLKAKDTEPTTFYEVVGVYRAAVVNGVPLVLVLTYYANCNSYQIIEYQTSMLCQRPKLREPKDYMSLQALKAAKHDAYFKEELTARHKTFKAMNLNIETVDDLLLYLIDKAIAAYGIINKLPIKVLELLGATPENELEDMF